MKAWQILLGIAVLGVIAFVMLQGTVVRVKTQMEEINTMKNVATEAQESAEAHIGTRLTSDTVYFRYDTNPESPTYKNAVALWIQVRVPKYGSPVDLRKTTLIVTTNGNEAKAEYAIPGKDACSIKDPRKDVDYKALNGETYAAVWINCDGKKEDYLIYPGQIAMLVYAIPTGLDGGKTVNVTIDITDGARYTFTATVPAFNGNDVVSAPV